MDRSRILMINYRWVVALILITLVVQHSALYERRKLRATINPDCNLSGLNCTAWTNTSVIHIRSDGINDSLHFVWSFLGSPSLLFARTQLESNLYVDWDGLLSKQNNSVHFTPEPLFTFAYTLNKVWIYNDTNDDVAIDKVNQSYVRGFDSEGFQWERQDYLSILKADDVKLTFIAGKYRDHGLNGSFAISIRAKEEDGYSEILPYMLHNNNMTQVDFTFNNVQMDFPVENPKNARVAFTLTMAQGNESQRRQPEMTLERVMTLDDEHTPGVFSTMTLRTPIHGDYDQAFLQWKPICYTQQTRDITNSIDVTSYPLVNQNVNFTDRSLDSSLLWAYYGFDLKALNLQALNISFGTNKDGFYKKTPQLSWTHMMGYGEPPKDYVSAIVMLVVAIGFGIPAVIIVVSSSYVLYRRFTKPRDEVLLGRY